MTTDKTNRSGPACEPCQPASNMTSPVSEINCELPPNTASIPWKTGTPVPTNAKVLQVSCSRCGTAFERKAKEVRRSQRRYGPEVKAYCSRACANPPNPERNVCACGEWKADHATQCKACFLKDTYVELSCSDCGTEFKRRRYEHERNVERHGGEVKTFCSTTCYRKYKTKQQVASEQHGECQTCSGPLYNKQRKYCSHTCYMERKKRNGAYQGGWSKAKRAIKARDGNWCQNCGSVKKTTDVHHIDHDATNNEMSNLILLCQPCHSHYHQRCTPIVQALLQEHYQSIAGLKNT